VFREVSVTPAAVSATPFDVWSSVTTAWDFGDGTSGAGEALAHAFAAGTVNVTARARDRFGHEAVATRPLTIAAPPVIAPSPAPPVVLPAPPAPPPALNNLVGNNRDVRDRRFTLTLPVVRAPIPKDAVATVTCLGKGCPFKTKKSAKVKQGEINLLPLLSKRQRRLKAGMTVEVRLTAPASRAAPSGSCSSATRSRSRRPGRSSPPRTPPRGPGPSGAWSRTIRAAAAGD